jgi:hypothetical protein
MSLFPFPGKWRLKSHVDFLFLGINRIRKSES